MAVVVDLQGFKIPTNRFILKELGIMRVNFNDTNCDKMTTMIFSPPCAWDNLPLKYQIMNRWCERNLHGIPWESGTFPYEEIDDTLKSVFHNTNYIFVKGSDKKLWINQLLNFSIPVIDLENLNCPPLRRLRAMISTVCSGYHKNSHVYNCALQNASKLRWWFLNVYGAEPSSNKSMALFYQLNDLSKMTTEDIACLSKDFILRYARYSRNFEIGWYKLPKKLQKDKDIMKIRFDAIRYASPNFFRDDIDEVDGPTPSKKKY